MEFMPTEHLIIRRMRPEDWSDLLRYLGDEDAQRLQNHGIYTKSECQSAISELSKYNTSWTVCLKSNQLAIGFITLLPMEPLSSKTYKLNFNIDPDYLSNNFIYEANKRMLQYAFEELAAHRIIGWSNSQDSSTNKEYVKLKMRKEGIFLKAYTYRSTKTKKPIWWDVNQFAIVKEEWLRLELE